MRRWAVARFSVALIISYVVHGDRLMGQEPVIVEISSDEEDEVVYKPNTKNFRYDSSMDWLTDMLGLDDDPWTSGNLEGVDELSSTSAVKKLNNVLLTIDTCVSADDSDDDCKILDEDPDKPTEAPQDEADCSDELLVVGEKGQVACRDFPHSRHLCATFPFNTGSHDKFCKMCHCYVCDVPAPCAHWIVHCHSTDREARWVSERKSLRHLKNPAPNHPATSVPLRLRDLPLGRSSSSSLPAAPRAPGMTNVGAGSVAIRAPVPMQMRPAAAPSPPLRHCTAAEPSRRLMQPLPPPLSHRSQSSSAATHVEQMMQPDISSYFPKVPTKRARTSLYTHQAYCWRAPPRPAAAAEGSLKSWHGAVVGQMPPPNLGKNFRPYAPVRPQPYKPRGPMVQNLYGAPQQGPPPAGPR